MLEDESNITGKATKDSDEQATQIPPIDEPLPLTPLTGNPTLLPLPIVICSMTRTIQM